MRTALLPSIAAIALVSVVVTTRSTAAEPLRLTPSQMDTATAGALSLRVIAAAVGSQFSQAQGTSKSNGSANAKGLANACCGFGSVIKILIARNGLSYVKNLNSASKSSNTLATPARLIPAGNGVSGKIEKFF